MRARKMLRRAALAKMRDAASKKTMLCRHAAPARASAAIPRRYAFTAPQRHAIARVYVYAATRSDMRYNIRHEYARKRWKAMLIYQEHALRRECCASRRHIMQERLCHALRGQQCRCAHMKRAPRHVCALLRVYVLLVCAHVRCCASVVKVARTLERR